MGRGWSVSKKDRGATCAKRRKAKKRELGLEILRTPRSESGIERKLKVLRLAGGISRGKGA